MKRREFISLLGGAAAAWPLPARAQQGEQIRRIGVLMGIANDAEGQARMAAFRQGLHERGWTEGPQRPFRLSVGCRQPRQHPRRCDAADRSGIPCHAGQQHDRGDRARASDAKYSDRIRAGCRSGARRNRREPGASGRQRDRVHQLRVHDGGKWLETLKEIAPGVALLHHPDDPNWPGFLRAIEQVAPSFSVQLAPAGVRDAADIEAAVDAFSRAAKAG